MSANSREPEKTGHDEYTMAGFEGLALLAFIVESSTDAIISQDQRGTITSWNKGAERMFGYTAREAIGLHVSAVIPPDRAHEEDQIQEKIRRGELISHFETLRVRKDGGTVNVSVNISPIRNGDGQIVGASKIVRDITGQKQTEGKLRLVVGALEAAANGIVITDRKGVICWVNRAFEMLTGYDAKEVMGLTPNFLKSGKQDDSLYAVMWQTIAKGEVWRGELVNKRKDGSFYNEDMMITPLRDSNGMVTHFIAIKQDITERVKAAAEREHLIGELQKALSEVKTLRGLLPVCAHCKKIRDDKGFWSQVDVYLQHNSNVMVTHGICPDCAKKMLDELKGISTTQ